MADLLTDLRNYRDAGDAAGYYRRLSEAGDRYGDLAGVTLSELKADDFVFG